MARAESKHSEFLFFLYWMHQLFPGCLVSVEEEEDAIMIRTGLFRRSTDDGDRILDNEDHPHLPYALMSGFVVTDKEVFITDENGADWTRDEFLARFAAKQAVVREEENNAL